VPGRIPTRVAPGPRRRPAPLAHTPPHRRGHPACRPHQAAPDRTACFEKPAADRGDGGLVGASSTPPAAMA